ncbi:MAG: Fe-S cluster assembly protein SufD [Alphaproteobacteria bacterium]|nr:MAG: Fe-S cluster assembly protein SufD [Alphaproteobacteria bacterium]
MSQLTPLASHYLDRFEQDQEQMPGHGRPALEALRRTALAAFSDLDFPGRKVEEWKFTPLNSLTRGIEPVEGKKQSPLPEFHAPHVMTFVNGRFAADKSHLDRLPDGISLSSLANELEAGREDLVVPVADRTAALVALNTAFMEDGAVLELAENAALDAPVILRFVSLHGVARDAHHLRNIIRLGKGASLTLVEEYIGPDGHAYFANPRNDVTLDEGAALNHYKLQAESLAAFHLAETEVTLAKGAAYENFSLSTGGRLSRNELTTHIEGAGATSALNGAYLMRGEQHCDTTTLTRHLVPENDSRQVYKGVLDGKAQGVFQGKIHIAADAQKVAGDQLSRSLLLSDTASVSVKPELEIFADDVKCSHGASSGELDETALFYMRSRGLTAEEARRMLIHAFLADVIEEVSDEQVRSWFSHIAERWLNEVQG